MDKEEQALEEGVDLLEVVVYHFCLPLSRGPNKELLAEPVGIGHPV
jgi:hypothetical protein